MGLWLHLLHSMASYCLWHMVYCWMGSLLTDWLQELTTLNMLHFGVTKTLIFNWMFDPIVRRSHSNECYSMLKKRKKI